MSDQSTTTLLGNTLGQMINAFFREPDTQVDRCPESDLKVTSQTVRYPNLRAD